MMSDIRFVEPVTTPAPPFAERPPSSIAILRALYLGDLLCAVPAWRALRAAFPQARIALIGLPWAESFARRFHRQLDEFIEFPGYQGIPEVPVSADRITAFLRGMQRRRFDLVLQMHGNGRHINALVALLGARVTAGFCVPGDFSPDAERFLAYPDDLPEIRRHLELMAYLGIPLVGEHLEFPVTEDDRGSLRRLLAADGVTLRDYLCLHPGGRGLTRRWPAQRFAAVADALAARGHQVVLTGTAEEDTLAREVCRAMRRSAVNLIGRTDLGALGALLAGARLLVANDTGVSHMAAALKLPSVIVSTGSDPRRWNPLDRERHRVLPGDSTTVAAVLAQAEDLLQEAEHVRA